MAKPPQKLCSATGQMHRAALAAADARAFAHHLRHQGLGVDAARQGQAMIAIGGDGVVTRFHGGQGADAHRFLAAVKMQINAGDALFLVEFVTGFLELSNQDHLPVPVQQNVTIGKRGRRLRYPWLSLPYTPGSDVALPGPVHSMESRLVSRRVQCTRYPLHGQSRAPWGVASLVDFRNCPYANCCRGSEDASPKHPVGATYHVARGHTMSPGVAAFGGFHKLF